MDCNCPHRLSGEHVPTCKLWKPLWVIRAQKDRAKRGFVAVADKSGGVR